MSLPALWPMLSGHRPPCRSAAGDARASELIEKVRRQVVAGGGAQGGVELLHLLGQGSVRKGGEGGSRSGWSAAATALQFDKVYKGMWQG